jgi:hypothetical protein
MDGEIALATAARRNGRATMVTRHLRTMAKLRYW